MANVCIQSYFSNPLRPSAHKDELWGLRGDPWVFLALLLAWHWYLPELTLPRVGVVVYQHRAEARPWSTSQ